MSNRDFDKGGDKKQKIQWDEETIAEHDKERGSRWADEFEKYKI